MTHGNQPPQRIIVTSPNAAKRKNAKAARAVSDDDLIAIDTATLIELREITKHLLYRVWQLEQEK